mmetsp:Transcript_26232/g.79003  ORF Transcript_26232/g.79003 Transcript_26232/m.79003 type:complete len:198 (-) Transcript_26232:174-767(-)
MRDFVTAVMQDSELKARLQRPDILFTTAPCPGRTVLREENNVDPEAEYSDDDLFFLQLILIQLLKPKRVISEMTPPNKNFHADHYALIHDMEMLGYEVSVTDRFPSDLCGDVQHRERWIMIGRLKTQRKLKPLKMTHHQCHSPQFWRNLNWYHMIAGSRMNSWRYFKNQLRTQAIKLHRTRTHTVQARRCPTKKTPN